MKQRLLIIICFTFTLLKSYTSDNSSYTSSHYVERNDLHYFMCIDSTRSVMLFMDGLTKQKLLCLESMDSNAKEIVHLPAVNSMFSGTAEYIRVLPDGNYLIYEEVKDECNRIWKFFPDDNRLLLTFIFRNKYQALKYNWGVEYDSDHGLLFISEYGNSLDNPVDPEDATGSKELGTKAGATKIWVSSDNGEHWIEYFDFTTIKDINPLTFHIHAIHYDVYDKVLYVTSGDGKENKGHSNKRLWWTKDGYEWHNRDWRFYWGRTNDANSHAQQVSLYADKDFIVAAGDDYNNCMYRIEKQSNPEYLKLEKVYFYDTDVEGLITQYATRIRKLSNGMIVTMLIGGDGNGFPRRTRMIGSYDGRAWFEIFSGNIETADDFCTQSGIFEEWNGHLYFLLRQNIKGKYKPRFIELDIDSLDRIKYPMLKASAETKKSQKTLYDLSGHALSKQNKGVNIIHNTEGTTKKVLTY